MFHCASVLVLDFFIKENNIPASLIDYLCGDKNLIPAALLIVMATWASLVHLTAVAQNLLL